MKRTLLALTLLAALPFAASAAEGVSYNYVEGGYVGNRVDGNTDADGWALGGSAAISDHFHLFGQFDQQEVDNFNEFDIEHWRAGVGYNHEISPKVDLVTRVAYEKYELDSSQVDSVDGYSVEAGVRGALTKNLEGYALAGYEDGSDFDGDYYGRVGAQVKFNQTWGITGDVKFADGNTQYFVGPRISF